MSGGVGGGARAAEVSDHWRTQCGRGAGGRRAAGVLAGGTMGGRMVEMEDEGVSEVVAAGELFGELEVLEL